MLAANISLIVMEQEGQKMYLEKLKIIKLFNTINVYICPQQGHFWKEMFMLSSSDQVECHVVQLYTRQSRHLSPKLGNVNCPFTPLLLCETTA